MKKIILSFLLLIFNFGFSQNKFSKGYFIDKSNNRVDCFIKNEDWSFFPSFLQYKSTEEDNVKSISIDQLNEFKTEESEKFIRHEVKIDRSRVSLSDLKASPAPEFVTEKIFLKEVITGKVNLYSYNTSTYSTYSKYFIKFADSNIEQLVYKMYGTSTNLKYNNYYKTQLEQTLNCDLINSKDIKKLNYTLSDIKDLI